MITELFTIVGSEQRGRFRRFFAIAIAFAPFRARRSSSSSRS